MVVSNWITQLANTSNYRGSPKIPDQSPRVASSRVLAVVMLAADVLRRRHTGGKTKAAGACNNGLTEVQSLSAQNRAKPESNIAETCLKFTVKTYGWQPVSLNPRESGPSIVKMRNGLMVASQRPRLCIAGNVC